MEKYKEAFIIDNFEGTKFAFLSLLEKLLLPIKDDDYVKVKMSLKWKPGGEK